MYDLTIRASAADKIIVPRAWRFIFCERLRIPWRRNDGLARTLPLAVKLNLFLALDLFFSLGILFCFLLLESFPPDQGINLYAEAEGYSPKGLRLQYTLGLLINVYRGYNNIEINTRETIMPMIASDEKIYAAMTRAARQLESAVKEQETAVNRILGLCEAIYSKLGDRGTKLQVEAIMEACSFQDITGQRIHKVERLILYLRDGGGITADVLPHETTPHTGQGGLSQAEIDRLLAGGKPLGHQK